MVRDTNSGKGYKHDTICYIHSTRGQDINVQVNNALLHQQGDRLKSVCLSWGISGTSPDRHKSICNSFTATTSHGFGN